MWFVAGVLGSLKTYSLPQSTSSRAVALRGSIGKSTSATSGAACTYY
ncbi:hypothetical protein [Simonsiella muelleri]|nr:hypothetical protein [Simonsiella muelleri]